MILKFKDWKITTKIFVSFINLIILFLFVVGISYVAITDINGNKMPLLLANEDVTISMLEMRKNEKDFLLRESSNLNFFNWIIVRSSLSMNVLQKKQPFKAAHLRFL